MNNLAVPRKILDIYNKALFLSTRGDYPTAVDEYMRAIALQPNFIEAYNNVGEIYSRLGDRDKALSMYNRALGIERHHKVLLNIGVEYYNRGDYQAALKFFSESISKEPDFLEGNFYMGLAYFNLRDYINSEKNFSKVINLDKKHLKGNYLLSYIYYDWKKYGKALECLKNIWDIADDKSFINRYYGFCQYHMGNYKEAVKYLSIALESSPRYAQFKDYLKGLTYENKLKEIGDLDKKIREMEEKIMNEKPTLCEYSQLGMLYIFKGEYRKAEDLLVSAKK